MLWYNKLLLGIWCARSKWGWSPRYISVTEWIATEGERRALGLTPPA